MKEQTGNLVYGLYANTTRTGPDAEVIIGGAAKDAERPERACRPGRWTHLAATYDGSTLRLYVNGTQVAQLARPGSISHARPARLRIGGNGVWGEWFNGWIDEVRIYNRALSAGEIQNDMITSVTPDTTPPTVVAKTPADGAAGINVGTPGDGDVQRAR